MMRIFSRFWNDEEGAAAIEGAFAIPTLVLMFFGLMQVGILLWSQASLANAVGQAARFATIYPSPSNEDIENYAMSEDLGIDTDRITAVNVSRGTDDGRNYVEIEMTYQTPTDFIFFEGPTVTIDQTRRAYTYD